MAKSKSAGATKSKAVAAAKRASAAASRAMTNESIGQAAGEVWQLLDSQGAQSVPAIKKATSVSDDLVLAAIGWLAREDKLNFSKSGRSLTISLR
ncbi:MAG TPA: winged helix-turn-helix domain-containing protein [Lacipirellulaceae bacterium]|nr:winged helix-turn-helix domain-containing protein [Lacipirellulaceae bacterium]